MIHFKGNQAKAKSTVCMGSDEKKAPIYLGNS